MRIIPVCLSVIVIISGLSGCADKDRIPSGIIDRDKMGKILWDMVEADQFAATYMAKDSVLIKDTSRTKMKIETLKLYQEVFRLYDISRDEFTKSYRFYQDRPDLSRGIFDSLLAKGNRLRQESYTRPPVTPPPSTTPALQPISKGKGMLPKPALNRPGSMGRPGGMNPGGVPGRPGTGAPVRPAQGMPFKPGTPGRPATGMPVNPATGTPLRPGTGSFIRPGTVNPGASGQQPALRFPKSGIKPVMGMKKPGATDTTRKSSH